MGDNLGVIQVAASAQVTAEVVLGKVEAYWVKKGGRVAQRTYREMLANGFGPGGTLGYVVLREEAGWIDVVDSVRYNADFSLARYLAMALETDVRFFGHLDVAQVAIERWFGPNGEGPPSNRELRRPHFIYSNCAYGVPEGALVMILEGLDESSYDRGPEPDAETYHSPRIPPRRATAKPPLVRKKS